MIKLTIFTKGAPYEYEACGKKIGGTECPRVHNHEGECRVAIPFDDFKVIATAASTKRREP